MIMNQCGQCFYGIDGHCRLENQRKPQTEICPNFDQKYGYSSGRSSHHDDVYL